MDPQLEEYRRKQRERASSARAQSTQKNKKQSWIVLAAVGSVVALVAVVYQQSIPNTAVGQSVSNAPAVVQGKCPKPVGFGTCVEDCSSDADCAAQGKLCCSNGCGHVCMAPETPGAASQRHDSNKCTLMVSLAGKTDPDVVMQAIPTPSKSNVLAAIGVVVLDYDAGRSNHCCEAKRTLDAKPELAKSVEYDGVAPDCDDYIEIVEDGPEFIDLDPDWKEEQPRRAGEEEIIYSPDWKETQPRREGEEEPIVGGWTEQSDKTDGVSEEHSDVWDQVVKKQPTYEGHELEKLGKPISVKSQVVAGVNYQFGFNNGVIVRVFHQPWSDTLEITDVDFKED